MLVAERLLLLLTAAETGRQAGRATLGHALSAAVVSDLALAGAVDYDSSTELLSAADSPSDLVLAPAYDIVRTKPLPLPLVVTRLARQPLKTWLVARSATDAPPLRLDEDEHDQPTSALVTLLATFELAARVVDHPDHSAKAIAVRAQEIADGEWGSAPVRTIVRAAAHAAVTPPSSAAMGAGLGL